MQTFAQADLPDRLTSGGIFIDGLFLIGAGWPVKTATLLSAAVLLFAPALLPEIQAVRSLHGR